MADQKKCEIKSLYSEILLRCSDVRDADAASIGELIDFLYACFVGILSQWLATNNVPMLTRTTNTLIQAARDMAKRLIA